MSPKSSILERNTHPVLLGVQLAVKLELVRDLNYGNFIFVVFISCAFRICETHSLFF